MTILDVSDLVKNSQISQTSDRDADPHEIHHKYQQMPLDLIHNHYGCNGASNFQADKSNLTEEPASDFSTSGD
ncbi:hypothetical protein SDJN02_22422, partial [Cucurbita argyrosperma subsp. argyrosperma]